MHDVDLEVDARGLLCPLPVLKLRKRIATLEQGQMACLLADDPAAHIDVPHFCAEAGHTFEGYEDRTDTTAFFVRRG